MLKKTIEYVDYNGQERKEDFYFNLNEFEITELEVSEKQGFVNTINEIVQSQDQKEIMRLFKEFVLRAYGIKSEDGKRFIKSEEISRNFSQTDAFNVLFLELLSTTDTMTAFVNGIIPKPADK